MQTLELETSITEFEDVVGQCLMSTMSLLFDCQEKEKPPSSSNSIVRLCSSVMASSDNHNVPSSPCSSLIGDYIGSESCLDLGTDREADFTSSATDRRFGKRYRGKKDLSFERKKDYPPPIPLLAQTENLPSHMPWVLERYYTSDGRLILREEKVRHHEYFRAHRSNGRLTLQLVPLDDNVLIHPIADHEEEDNKGNNTYEEYQETQEAEQNEEQEQREDAQVVNCVVNNVRTNDTTIIEADEDEAVFHKDQRVPNCMETVNGSAAAVGMCSKYNNVRTSSTTCIFGVPIPTMRPVPG